MPGLIRAEDSVLLLVDIQERFRAAVPDMDRVIRRSVVLLKAALRLGVPVLASEQYPKALGTTVEEIRGLLPDASSTAAASSASSLDIVFPKLCFSAVGCAPLLARLQSLGRHQVVLGGVEAHVCVLQTALELAGSGLEVYVVEDAVASRADTDRAAALARLACHGAERVTSEMVVFEWLRKAGTPEFKDVQALIK